MRMARTLIVAPVLGLLALLLTTPCVAQESAGYKLNEHSLNSGGHPAAGQVMASASFRISYDAVGSPMVRWGLAGPSFRMDASFGAAYPPPGEVAGLRFADRQTLVWGPEKSVGVYEVYRDLVRFLPDLDYGTCLEAGLAGETVTDVENPPPQDAFYYLVTARNRLCEEGTKGNDSSGGKRANDAPCP